MFRIAKALVECIISSKNHATTCVLASNKGSQNHHGGLLAAWSLQIPRSMSSLVAVHLGNLRDNPKATREVKFLNWLNVWLVITSNMSTYFMHIPWPYCLQRIRVGRGNSGRRGNYCGRGMNGHNSRSGITCQLLVSHHADFQNLQCEAWVILNHCHAGGGPHMLYDGGQLGLLKFPVTRERPRSGLLSSFGQANL